MNRVMRPRSHHPVRVMQRMWTGIDRCLMMMPIRSLSLAQDAPYQEHRADGYADR